MEGFGPEKMVFILVVLLLVFGSKRLPEIGSSLGKGIREFKKSMHDLGAPSELTQQQPHTQPVAATPQPPQPTLTATASEAPHPATGVQNPYPEVR